MSPAADKNVPIAVVGLACRYPGARNPTELWENVLARRQQFRRMPDGRLPLNLYFDANPDTPDTSYASRVAVLDGFRFDWAARRIPRTTYESTDIVHWLALEVALEALEDAGLEPDSVPRSTTGVHVGNTLAGEQSRAQGLRLRWPFVERALRKAAHTRGLDAAEVGELARELERTFKAPFAPITEDTLAGGLANTIAGRICNYLDFHGGGYTVDGACASSLLAVAHGATDLASGRLDLALVGGVDVSLDTFELVGFSKMGALATGEMRVYDERAAGFIAGEGCGFAVLKRLDDARRDGNTVYAELHGWGISSDGRGGLTAPSSAGQALAIRRAHERSPYTPGELDFVEGHGTGTAVGDPVELIGIARAIGPSDARAPEDDGRTCGVTSLKSIVGHTKAAAGIGGFIKAVTAAYRRVVPPLAGCERPNRTFREEARALYPIRHGQTTDRDLRAGVTGAGFGGINCHVTLRSADRGKRLQPGLDESSLLGSHQDSEVFVFGAASPAELIERTGELGRAARGLSRAEMVDLAAEPTERTGAYRAALIAGSADELEARVEELAGRLGSGDLAGPEANGPGTLWVGRSESTPRVGLLFPGQGSQFPGMAARLIRRHPWARELVEKLRNESDAAFIDAMLPDRDRLIDADALASAGRRLSDTRLAQPAIVVASILWLRWLDRVGIRPAALAGHSLGELTAFCAAGLVDAPSIVRLAAVRGRAMAGGEATGAMLAIAGKPDRLESTIADGLDVVLANRNSPRQLVYSGPVDAIDKLAERAREAGLAARRLAVTQAFHSRLVAGAADVLRADPTWPAAPGEPRATLIRGQDGREVSTPCSLSDHFADQVLAPVDFIAVAQAMSKHCDLMIEVGPGRALSGLITDSLEGRTPCLPVESRADRDVDANTVLAALHVHGADIDWPEVYRDRLVRPFVPVADREFLTNPCESIDLGELPELERRPAETAPDTTEPEAPNEERSATDLLLDLAASATGFPRDALSLDNRLLEDLNLDSIKAAALIGEATRRMGIEGRVDPARLAGASLAEIAETLRKTVGGQAARPEPSSREATLRELGMAGSVEAPAPVGNAWVRDFAIAWEPTPVRRGNVPKVDRVRVVGDEPAASELAAALAGAGLDVARGWPDTFAAGETLVVRHVIDGDTRSARSTLARIGSRCRPSDGPVAVTWLLSPHGQESEAACAGIRAFAASLHLERPGIRVRSVEVPPGSSAEDLVGIFHAESTDEAEFAAVRRDAGGGRRRAIAAVLRPTTYRERRSPLGRGDHLLVSGGARGITAECALGLARSTGARTTLLGRSPNPPAEVDREYRQAGLEMTYRACDVTDAEQVEATLRSAAEEYGPVHTLIHGAARNTPGRLEDRSSTDDVAEELAPKLDGIDRLLEALRPTPPRHIVGMTSILAITGMPGNAWYAYANAELDARLALEQARRPELDVTSIAFSVWGETGMAPRLGVLDRLRKLGTEPVSTRNGVAHFVRLVRQDPGRRLVVVSSRTGGLGTWSHGRTRLPFASRFLENIETHVPGVEVRARAALSLERDTYLREHAWRGTPLFPAVFGLEAMAQAAAAAVGIDRPRVWRILDLVLDEPILVPLQEETTIETHARVAETGLHVQVGIRASTSGFRRDHFSATFVFDDEAPETHPEIDSAKAVEPFDAADHYGSMLFQEGRFRRLGVVRGLDERRIELTVTAGPAPAFEPEDAGAGPWLLGDPFRRDGLLQAGQFLVTPDLCLPSTIGRLEIRSLDRGDVHASAEITARDERSVHFRAVARDDGGAIVEAHDEALLRVVERDEDLPTVQALARPRENR